MNDETAVYLRVGGETVRVAGRSAVVGRSRDCDVRIEGRSVSRRHCEVLLRDDGVVVRDLGSAHGTWIDGRLTIGEARLEKGAPVSLGGRGPRFELVAAVLHGRPAAAGRVAEPPTQNVEVAAPASPPAASSDRGFLVGLAWGLAAGLVAGVVVLALSDVPS